MTFSIVAALATIGGGSAAVGGALVAVGASTALSAYGAIAVSYTHLTLPTSDLV